ncbi:hypothetical protein RKD52_003713 [Metabacillus sp. SLBN-84]
MFLSELWSIFQCGVWGVNVLIRALEHFSMWSVGSKCSFLILPNRFTVLKGTIQIFAYPPRSFYGSAGYDSTTCLPSQIVLQFRRVRFNHLLTLPNRFTVSQGTIHALAYPPRLFYSFAGYDSCPCLPFQIVLQFCRVRFNHLLTLPDRFTVLQGTIALYNYYSPRISHKKEHKSSAICTPIFLYESNSLLI